MLILGCDYSASTIYMAFLHYGKLDRTICLGVPKPVDTEWTFAIRLLLEDQGIDAIYVEAPWANSFNHMRGDTGSMMARVAAIIETVAAFLEIPCHMVPPGTWRKEILGKGGGKTTAQFKQMAIDHVAEAYPHWKLRSLKVRSYEPDHNEAESICIAEYGDRTFAREIGSGT